MNYYKLIFSTQWIYKIKRHIIFWLAVFLYHFVRIGILFPPAHFLQNIIPILIGTFIWGIVGNIVACYSMTYYLVPNFFNKKRYILFVLFILLLCAFLFALATINIVINAKMRHAIGTINYFSLFTIRLQVIRVLGNPPLIFGLFLSLKTMKNWYLKQKENEMLVRENTNAELQLLKAQIHPHFLFNTLNNIYSFTLTKSPDAEVLIEKLTDTLHYMIKDCDMPLVLLEKEIKMISDYIELERVRYGNQLQMEIQIDGDRENKLIAPLLLIPFVENSFKHGTSKMLEEPWIKIKIVIEDGKLLFELVNSKPKQNSINGKKGIGLANVQKRLELLYPKKYSLNMESNADSFFVQMNLPLLNKTATMGTPSKLLQHQ